MIEDATNYYVLGYAPAVTPDGKFHKNQCEGEAPGTLRPRSPWLYGLATHRRNVQAMPAATPRSSNAGSPPSPEPVAGAPAEPVAPLSEPEMPAPPDALVTASLDSVAADTNPPSAVRWRPDAGKHIDLLLPNPSADKAAADGWAAYQRGDVVSARMALRVAVASPAAEAWTHYVLGQADYALRDTARR